MSFAIVSNWHDSQLALKLAEDLGQVSFGKLARLVMPSRRQYALAHGYKSLEFRKAGHYGKLFALLQAWEAADWLWWLDIDAIITRPELGLEGLALEGDVIISCDSNGLNSGSMLLRTIPEVRRILREAVQLRGVFDVPPWHDQNALAYLLWKIRDRVRVVDQSRLNSYPADWTPESFVLHCPGMSNALRLDLLGRHLARLQ